MSDEMKFKNDYQDTFNEVHAPVELSRKVMNMQKKEEKKTAVSFMRKLAAVAAIALVIFVGGNGIVYAATGNSLLKTVKIYFNGTSYEAKLEEKVDEDSGVTYYVGTFEDVEGDIDMAITDADDFEEVPYEVALGTPTIVEENEKIYLVDGELKMDITEDAKDGSASGTYEKDELTYEYEVTKEDGTWEVNISNGDYVVE